MLPTNDNSAAVPLLYYQCELPVDCKDYVGIYSLPAAPNDRDNMSVTYATVASGSRKKSRYWN